MRERPGLSESAKERKYDDKKRKLYSVYPCMTIFTPELSQFRSHNHPSSYENTAQGIVFPNLSSSGYLSFWTLRESSKDLNKHNREHCIVGGETIWVDI